MARALWSGSLSFGLVNVPVQLLTAVRDRDLHFHQLHERDGARIEMHRYCSKEEVEVELDEIAHLYERDRGKDVILTDEELAAAAPERTRTIDIEQFVDLAEVDPILFDHPYFLVPSSSDDGATRAYRLLVEAMSASDRAALGRFVMRTKEYLALVRERGGVLSLTTLRFADEVRPRKGINTGSGKSHAPGRKALDTAVAVIEELGTEWDPAEHRDRYRDRLRRIVDKKRKGETIKAPSEPERDDDGAPDLMAALEATLEQMREGKSKQRTAKTGNGSRRKTARK